MRNANPRLVAFLIFALPTAQGIAGAGEGPIRVELAEDVIFVSARESGGQAGDVDCLVSRLRLPVGAQGRVTEIGDETNRRQRIAARGHFQCPAQGRADHRRHRRPHTLQPKSLGEELASLVQVAQFVDGTHDPTHPTESASLQQLR